MRLDTSSSSFALEEALHEIIKQLYQAAVKKKHVQV